MKLNTNEMFWLNEPNNYQIKNDKIEILTEPHTDLWQRTYYHFRNDNAPMLQFKTSEEFFSFLVKTEFDSKHRFDQCGVIMYQNSENWLKTSIEYENSTYQHLGSVVTNNGYSDWAVSEIDSSVRSIWYRISRRDDDFCIEYSYDGNLFHLMRIFHMFNITETINIGIYACSPEDSSFKATFSHLELTDCKWKAHDGQKPDEDLL